MADISPDDARLQQLLVQGRQRAETAAADAAGADTNTLPISPILPPSSTPLSAGQNPVSDEQRLQQLIQEGNDRAKANAANVEAAGGFWPMVGSALGSGGRYVLGEAGSLAHGLGAGLAALPDVAGAATAGIANIPRRIENTFSAPDQQQPLIVAPTTFEDLYNRYVPPVKGYENSIGETVGRVAAPLILTGGAGTIPEIAAMGAASWRQLGPICSAAPRLPPAAPLSARTSAMASAASSTRRPAAPPGAITATSSAASSAAVPRRTWRPISVITRLAGRSPTVRPEDRGGHRPAEDRLAVLPARYRQSTRKPRLPGWPRQTGWRRPADKAPPKTSAWVGSATVMPVSSKTFPRCRRLPEDQPTPLAGRSWRTWTGKR